MTQFDTADRRTHFARASAHLTLTLIDLLVERQLLTTPGGITVPLPSTIA